jgi:hypothetical protein
MIVTRHATSRSISHTTQTVNMCDIKPSHKIHRLLAQISTRTGCTATIVDVHPSNSLPSPFLSDASARIHYLLPLSPLPRSA